MTSGLFSIFCVSYASYARADSLESETSAGASILSEGLNYRFSSKQADSQGGRWEGTFGYTYFRSTNIDGVTGTSISDTSQEGSLEVAYRNTFDLGAGLSYGVTPAESLRQISPSVSLGFHLKYGAEPKEPSDEAFRPEVSFKVRLSKTHYTEDFSSTSRLARVVRSRAASNETLSQSAAEVNLGWDPLEWLNLGVSYTRYTYDKDVPRFMTFLESPLAMRSGRGSFGDTVSGLYARSVSGSVSLRPGDSWEIGTEIFSFVSEVDDSTSPGAKLMVSRDLSEAWNMGLGAEHSVSSGFVTNSAILSLSYSF